MTIVPASVQVLARHCRHSGSCLTSIRDGNFIILSGETIIAAFPLTNDLDGAFPAFGGPFAYK